MPTYPAQIDSTLTLPPAVDNFTPVQGSVFNVLRNAVIAIENELGIKPSGIYSTARARLDNLENIIGNLQIIELEQDLGGTIASPLVIGIQGRPVSNIGPLTNQVLTWNGIAWIPASSTLPVFGQTFGQYLTWNGNSWSGVTLSGDVAESNSTLGQITVTGLQGRALSNTAPSTGQFLGWNGTTWLPSNAYYVDVKTLGAKGDGITNDSNAIQTALNNLSGTGFALWFSPGTYLISNTITIPSNTIIWGSPSAILLGNISGTYPLTGSILRTGLSGAAAASTTINATATIGATTFTVASGAGIVAGGFIYVADAHATTARRTLYLVESVSGTTITVDRPISTAYVTGDTVSFYTSAQVPQGIIIYGNRMQIQGASVVAISFQTAYKCEAYDLIFNAASPTSPSDAAFGFNNGSAICVASRIMVDGYGGGSPSVGIGIESTDGCIISYSTVQNCAGNGMAFIESTKGSFINCMSLHNSYGYVWTNDILSTRGSDWCSTINCQAIGNTNDGFIPGAGSLYVSIIGGVSSGNGGIGFNTASSTFATDFTIDGTTITNNTGGAVVILAGAKRGKLSNLTIDAGAASAFDIMSFADDCQCSNISIIGGGGAQRPIIANGGDVLFTNLNVFRKTSGTASFGISVNNGTLTIQGGKFILGVNGDIGLTVTGGKMIVENFKVSPGSATGTFGIFTSGGVLRILENVDVSATATPLDFTGGIQNRFTKVLAGAATTVVSWTDLKSTDNIELQIQSVAGTLEAPYQITPNPGTGFTITPLGASPSLDTSTLQVYIS